MNCITLGRKRSELGQVAIMKYRFIELPHLHQVCSTMSEVELGHITIRKAVAVRFGDIGHRFQKLMSLDGAVLDHLHEIRPYIMMHR